MQIQIQFIDVSVEDKGKYKMAEVTYKDLAKGQTSSKKLMSFNNATVYKTLVDAKKGEVYTIEMQKNDKGYWDWINASVSNGVNTVSNTSTEAVGASKASGYTSPKSTYETPEERAKKQVYIIRQSSAATAVAALKTDKKNPTIEEVISYARQLEDYVLGQEIAPKLAELPVEDEDIPV